MAQTDILRERLFNVEKTDENYLYFSHRDVQNAQADEKKNDVNLKSEPMHSVPQLFNNIGLDLTLHNRSGSNGDNTIFDDAEYFLEHHIYKLMPITFGNRNEKNDAGKKSDGIVVEEIDEKLINMEHDYCSVSSESDGEFEFSRTIPYHVYKKRNRSKKRGRIKQTKNNEEASPNGTDEIDITDANGSNTDLHLIEPDYSELSFYSKNLFSYKEENHSEGLQPIDLSLSLPEESKTDDNGISSPTDNNNEKENMPMDLNIPIISSATEHIEEKASTATDLSVSAMLSPKNIEKREYTATELSVPAISSPGNIERRENTVTNLSVPEILSPVENNEVEDNAADLNIPKLNKENVVENNYIEVRFSRPGFPDYKPSRQFIHNIAKKVPDLLKDKSDKINILDCTYGSINNNGKINYYFVSEEMWRLFKNSSERIVLTNDSNCGERVKVNKENDIPTFLVFDESSLADSLKTLCKDIGYKYKFTLLEDSGEKLVKILEDEDCVEQNEKVVQSEVLYNENRHDQLGSDSGRRNEPELPVVMNEASGVINSGILKNLLLKSSRLRLKNQVRGSGSVNETSLNSKHKILPFKKSWKMREDVILYQAAEEVVKNIKKATRKKERRKDKHYGIINSGYLRAMLFKNNPIYQELMKGSYNLVNGIPVNQNNLMCSEMPFTSQKRKVKKDDKKKSKSKNKRSREISIEEIVDLGLHLGKRTRNGQEEFEIAKKRKKTSKKSRNEDNSLVNLTVNKTTENFGGNNSILSRLLLEGVKKDNVPKLQSTEIISHERYGDLNLHNAEDRQKLERALLSEKMRRVKVKGCKKKRELTGKGRSNSNGDERKVIKPRKKRVNSADGKLSEDKQSSIIGEASNSAQLSEKINGKVEKRGRKKGSVKIKEPTDSGGENKKVRGRPRKNNDIYQECFVFEPSLWVPNAAESKKLWKQNCLAIEKEKRHNSQKEKESKEETDFKSLTGKQLLIKMEPTDESTLDLDEEEDDFSSQSADAFERIPSVPQRDQIENKENNPNCNIEDVPLSERLEERPNESMEVSSITEGNDDSQISVLNGHNEVEANRDKEEAREVNDDLLMPVLSTICEERHIPYLKLYLKGNKARENNQVESTATEAVAEDPSMPVLSSELEKGEVCYGRDRSETVDMNETPPMPTLNISQIKEEQYFENNEPKPAGENSNEERNELRQEESEPKSNIPKESNSNSRRKSRSKSAAKKSKKRTKEIKVVKCKSPVPTPKNEALAIISKSPVIAKKGELNIETNIISPVVEIEKNKEIEEAVSKQLEENSMSPTRFSSRQRKIPRIFDESVYTTDTLHKKVKKSPEKKEDPDYQPKVKTRSGGKSEKPIPKVIPTENLKSSESDCITTSQSFDSVDKIKLIRTELFDPLSLSYERTTRSGTRFENNESLEKCEPAVVCATKKNASSNKKNDLKRKTICSSKMKNSTTEKTKEPEQNVAPRISLRSRHTIACIEKKKSVPSTRFSSRLKNV